MPRINISIPDDLASALDDVSLPLPVSRICQEALQEAVAAACGTAELVLMVPADLAREIRHLPFANDYCVGVLPTLLRQLVERHRTVAQVIADPAHAPLRQELLEAHDALRWAIEQLDEVSVLVDADRHQDGLAKARAVLDMLNRPLDDVEVVSQTPAEDFRAQLLAWVSLSPRFGSTEHEVLLTALHDELDDGRRQLDLALKRASEGKWIGAGSCFQSKICEAARSFRPLVTDRGDAATAAWEFRLEAASDSVGPDQWAVGWEEPPA